MFFDTYSGMLSDTVDGLKREDIQKLFDLIGETRNNEGHLFVLGNGGSAAATSHWVCDFGKRIDRGDPKRLKVFSPTGSGTVFSTFGSDCGYGATFVKQMKNLLEPDDLILTFSVSESSSDLVETHRYAKGIGAKTACVVADKGDKIIGTSDFAVIIPSRNYGVVGDTHVILGHAISQQIYVDNVEA